VLSFCAARDTICPAPPGSSRSQAWCAFSAHGQDNCILSVTTFEDTPILEPITLTHSREKPAIQFYTLKEQQRNLHLPKVEQIMQFAINTSSVCIN
jgi:hypothetical protein